MKELRVREQLDRKGRPIPGLFVAEESKTVTFGLEGLELVVVAPPPHGFELFRVNVKKLDDNVITRGQNIFVENLWKGRS